MAANTMKTILLKGDLGRRYEEALAGGTITPGHILQKASDDTVVVHATAGGAFGGAWDGSVAIEDALIGPDGVATKGNTIDDNYVSGDRVRFIYVAPGEVFNGILTTSQTIVIGAQLTSAGNGRLKVANGTSDVVIAIAEEAVTTTASTSRIAARRV